MVIPFRAYYVEHRTLRLMMNMFTVKCHCMFNVFYILYFQLQLMNNINEVSGMLFEIEKEFAAIQDEGESNDSSPNFAPCSQGESSPSSSYMASPPSTPSTPSFPSPASSSSTHSTVSSPSTSSSPSPPSTPSSPSQTSSPSPSTPGSGNTPSTCSSPSSSSTPGSSSTSSSPSTQLPTSSNCDSDDEMLWDEFETATKTASDLFTSDMKLSETEEKIKDFIISLSKWQCAQNISDCGVDELLDLLKPIVDKDVLPHLPNTVYKLNKMLGLKSDSFDKYIVCPECTKIYCYEKVVKTSVDGKTIVMKCNNKLFDKGKYSQECSSDLVQKVNIKSGQKYVPIKYYCYKSVINSIEQILSRPGMLEKCRKWRDRKIPDDVYCDIYDGEVWKKFDNGFFIKNNNTCGLSLNIDWFQPYKHRPDVSIGVIYLVLLNLPREERYKRENWVLAGVIPNLRKEPSSLQYFLEPLVKELKLMYSGVNLNVSVKDETSVQFIRAALILVSCDVPAARKTCGFLGHSAKLGCSKCLKRFPGSVGTMDYSGTDVHYWPKRTVLGHRKAIKLMSSVEQSKTSAKAQESNCGYRFTPLLNLPYFDTIRFCVIDVMHNLFTGIAKHFCGYLINNNYLSKEDLHKIDVKLGQLSDSCDNGWRPKCFSSRWTSWTAYEWKSWILTYSLYAFQDVLDEEHLNIWHSFVQACRHIVKPMITKTDIMLSHHLLVKFVTQVQNKYGPSVVTPNMHLSMHLREDMLNYGSVYGTWLFPFERFNFIVGTTITNNKSIELQFMRSVERYKYLQTMSPNVKCQPSSNFSQWSLLCPSGNADVAKQFWCDSSDIMIPESLVTFRLDKMSQNNLLMCYRAMYPELNIELSNVLMLCSTFNHVRLCNIKYSSMSSCGVGKKYAGVMASWDDDHGNICFDSHTKPCKVLRYIQHGLYCEDLGEYKHHIFAMVKWYKPYPEDPHYKNPISVWEKCDFVCSGPSSFLPVQRIESKFVWALHNANRLVISPVPPKVML